MNIPIQTRRFQNGASRIAVIAIVVAVALGIAGLVTVALLGGPTQESEPNTPGKIETTASPASRPDFGIATAASTPASARREDGSLGNSDIYDRSPALTDILFEISGRIVDAEKKPVDRAVVRIFVANATMPSIAFVDAFRASGLLAFEKTRKTDSSGKFALRGPFTGGSDYFIHIQSDANAPTEIHATPVEGGKKLDLGDITLAKGIEITGRIVDTSGNPIPEGRVGFILSPTELSIERYIEETEPEDYLVSDDQGAFTIKRLAVGRYTLVAWAPGFARGISPPVMLSPDKPARPIELTLGPGDIISGIISNSEGVGIPGATVKLRLNKYKGRNSPDSNQLDDSMFFDFPVTLTTDDAGAFTANGLHASLEYRVDASAEHYRSNGVSANAGATGISIILKNDFQISGLVVEKETGTVVGAARVAVFRGSFDQLKQGAWSFPPVMGITDSAGQFLARYAGPPENNSKILAWADGYAPTVSEAFNLEEGGDPPFVKVEIERGASIAGIVTHGADGKPAGDVALMLYHINSTKIADTYRSGSVYARSTSDPNGIFNFTGLLPGNYVVEARSSTFGSTRSDLVVLGGNEARNNVAVVIPTPGTIRGVVLTQAPGVSSVRVVAVRSDGIQFATFADATGRFVLDKLAPGEYRVRATQIQTYDELYGRWQAPRRGNEGTPVTLNMGQIIEITLDIPDPGLGKLIGTVIDAGNVASGYTLILVAENPSSPVKLDPNSPFPRVKTATADHEGNFEMSGVKEGFYRVFAIPRGRSAVPKNTIASEPLQIFRNATARRDLYGQSGALRGRVTSNNTPILKGRVTATVNGTRGPTAALPAGTVFSGNIAKNGSFDFGRVPGGSYDIVIDAPGFQRKVVPYEVYGGASDPIQIQIDPVKNAKPSQPQPPVRRR